MTYAVKYLAGAYRAAGGNPDRAVALYASGYGGARRAACRPKPAPPMPTTAAAVAAAARVRSAPTGALAQEVR